MYCISEMYKEIKGYVVNDDFMRESHPEKIP